jgi:hypothetical protein
MVVQIAFHVSLHAGTSWRAWVNDASADIPAIVYQIFIDIFKNLPPVDTEQFLSVRGIHRVPIGTLDFHHGYKIRYLVDKNIDPALAPSPACC